MKRPIDWVVWQPKVPREWVQRLYRSDGEGALDLDLLNQVGWGLYARCETILQVTAAHNEGRIICPVCARHFQRDPESDRVACACGWEVAWVDYHRSYKGKQLYAANAFSAFADFVRKFPGLSEPQEKMVEIDQLLHAFHLQIQEAKDAIIGRPAACNLLQGNLQEVCTFLDDLSSPNPGFERSKRAWRSLAEQADWMRPFLSSQDADQ